MYVPGQGRAGQDGRYAVWLQCKWAVSLIKVSLYNALYISLAPNEGLETESYSQCEFTNISVAESNALGKLSWTTARIW